MTASPTAASPTDASPTAASRRRASSTWPLGRVIGTAVLLMVLFSLAAVVVGVLALGHLDTERQRIESTLDPAALASEQLYSSLLNQETGVRGYALTGQADFLTPYTQGYAAEKVAVATLNKLAPQLPPDSAAELKATLTQAHDWRMRYAEPTIKQIQASGKPVVSPDILAGKAEFDALRARFATFQADVSSTRAQALTALDDASDELHVALLAIAIGFVLIVAGLAVTLRATAIRPVHRLAAEARRVADGDFWHEVGQSGPSEIRGLAADVNTMRLRILRELASWSSSPTWPRTTCRNRCARSPASASCCSGATAASSTSGPTSTSTSRSTAPSGCRC